MNRIACKATTNAAHSEAASGLSCAQFCFTDQERSDYTDCLLCDACGDAKNPAGELDWIRADSRLVIGRFLTRGEEDRAK